MQNLERNSLHSRLYFSFVGLGLSLLAVVVYGLVTRAAQGSWDELNTLLIVVIALATAAVYYRFRLLLTAREITYMLVQAALRWLQVIVITTLAYALIPHADTGVTREILLLWACVSLPLILLALYIMRRTAVRFYASGEHRRKAVFLNPGPESNMLAERLKRSPVLGIKVLGYFGQNGNDLQPAGANISGMKELGDLHDAVSQLRRNTYDVVFLSLSLFSTSEWQDIIDALSDSTASIYVVPEARMLGYFQIGAGTMAGIPLLSLHETQVLGMARILKRGLDIVVSALALVVLSPLLLLIAAAVRLSSPGPILFSQVRYGQSGEAINVHKFRSMYVHSADQGTVQQAQRNDPRVTPVGRILRRTSLDELPQLLNVLSGEMSLVGPRPHAAEHNELYRKQIRGYMLRHTVKPGITGWAQVNGLRGETETVEKMMKRVEYDRYYIQHWSLGLDIKILFRTAFLVIFDKAAY